MCLRYTNLNTLLRLHTYITVRQWWHGWICHIVKASSKQLSKRFTHHCHGNHVVVVDTYIYCVIWSHAVHTISTINHDLEPLSSLYVCCSVLCMLLSHPPLAFPPLPSFLYTQTFFHILFARTILNWAIPLNRFSKLYAFKMFVFFFGWRQNFDRQNIIILSSVIETYFICLASASMRKYAGT